MFITLAGIDQSSELPAWVRMSDLIDDKGYFTWIQLMRESLPTNWMQQTRRLQA